MLIAKIESYLIQFFLNDSLVIYVLMTYEGWLPVTPTSWYAHPVSSFPTLHWGFLGWSVKYGMSDDVGLPKLGHKRYSCSCLAFQIFSRIS